MDFPYKLKLNMRAFVRFEELTGNNIFSALGVNNELVNAAQENPEAAAEIFSLDRIRFSTAASVVWAGRLAETPDLTPEKNLDDIAELEPMAVFTAVAEALGASMGQDAKQSENQTAPNKS